jgi:hypothetical protein
MAEKKEKLAPLMERTKIQLETTYSPGALFTFEGSLVTCESLPKQSYVGANVTQYAETQILNSMEENITTWYQTAMSAESGPEAFMCVDKVLLNDDKTGLNETFKRDLFRFAEPSEMGYAPAILTLVCYKCKLLKTFSSLQELHKRQKELACKCSAHEGSRCSWRQMDIAFIHPNGNYRQPEPWVYNYSQDNHEVYKGYAQCSCGETDVRLEDKSAQIGKRYYYCANSACNMKRGNEESWVQNDKEWLEHFRENASSHISDIRMKAISSRSNSVHYPVQDMVIDFGKSEQLNVLADPSSTALKQFVAERFGLPVTSPDLATIKLAVIEAQGDEKWEAYESLLSSRDKLKSMLPMDGIEAALNSVNGDIASKEREWQKKGLFPTVIEFSPSLEDNLLQRKALFYGRYDPFRLLVEHKTLLERIVSEQKMENGSRHYTAMDHLDEHIGPDTKEERDTLNQQHRIIMDRVGIETVGLVRKFETLQYSYGFTRVDSKPVTQYINNREVPVRLKLFNKTRIDDDSRHPIFVLKQNNEGIYLRLQEEAVREWLKQIGTQEPVTDDPIGQQYLENVPFMDGFLNVIDDPTREKPSMSLAIYTLLHTYAHHVMMGIAEFSGLGTGSLGEYIFPADLSFIVYRRGMTMDMGNLTSMLRNNAPAFLEYIQDPRNLGCGSGSLCLQRGGACPDCLLIPEVNCIAQNKLLSRTVLTGKAHPGNCGFKQPIPGYMDVARSL